MSSNIDHLQQLTTVGNIVKHMPSFLFDFDDVVCILFQFLSVFLATSYAEGTYTTIFLKDFLCCRSCRFFLHT